MPQAPSVDDALTDHDYHLLVNVLDAVDQAPVVATFKRRLARALRHQLGCRAVAVTHGNSLDDADRRSVVLDGYPERFLGDYERNWAAVDPFRSPRARRLLIDWGVVSADDLRATATARQLRFLDDFLRSNGITRKFAVRIDCEPHGSVYLAVVPDDERSLRRTTALLWALRRHLTPIASRLLAEDHTLTLQPLWRLTTREQQVAALVTDGLTNEQIAQRLVIGVDTVKKHLSRVLAVTSSASRTQLAVRWAQRRHDVAAGRSTS